MHLNSVVQSLSQGTVGSNSRLLMSSFQDALTSATTTASAAVVMGASSSSGSPLAVLSSFKTSPSAVGVAWLVSSAVFTTYSATKFLKYSYSDDQTQLQRKLHKIQLPLHRYTNRFLSLPPASMLTMYRFAGSLVLGLLLHPDLAVIERFRSTMAAVPALAVPAAFLFVANFANS